MQYYFEAKSLTVGYQKKPLIRDITFSVNAGEILTLIGPNGGGKSTILKSITKQLELIGGVVSIGGVELSGVSYKELAKQLAVVLTERIQPEMMRCHEVVATGRYPYTGHLGILSERDEQIVEEAMRQADVLDLCDRDFREISDGQRQRVLLARAICQQPEIIVLDEPTSYLDIRHKAELLMILRTMAKEQKTTIIMSLHEIDLAQKISDQVLCVKGDVISHYGTPEEVFQKDIIRELYDIPEKLYNLNFGSVELVEPEKRTELHEVSFEEKEKPELKKIEDLDIKAQNKQVLGETIDSSVGEREHPVPRQTEDSDGKEKIFVISSSGSGITTYRKLARMGIPFYAGIIYENDIDYQVARVLAEQVVAEQAFEPISDRAMEWAKELLKKCPKVMICHPVIGTCNQRLNELIQCAREWCEEISEEELSLHKQS